MPSSDRSWGESSSKSRRKPIPWLVRSLNACHISFMTSTLKRICKPALGKGQKSVDNYVDTACNSVSYPQALQPDGYGSGSHKHEKAFPSWEDLQQGRNALRVKAPDLK